MSGERRLVMVRAVIRREKLDEVLAELSKAGYTGVTVYPAEGAGGEGGVVMVKGKPARVLIPRAVLEIVVEEAKAEEVMKIIMSSARTGSVGDGRIFVIPVLTAYRIRTGEQL